MIIPGGVRIHLHQKVGHQVGVIDVLNSFDAPVAFAANRAGAHIKSVHGGFELVAGEAEHVSVHILVEDDGVLLHHGFQHLDLVAQKGGNEMGILTFKGGVHPYDGKELSKNSPVVKYLPKGDMVYPLSQHIGAPAAAIVQKGDHVLAGQKIADAAGFVSSPIHSSVSGTVKGIEPRLTATGSMVNSIIIENDQQYESVEFTPARLEDLSKEEILARIKEGGVVGMGGAGFPTQVKLAPLAEEEKSTDTTCHKELNTCHGCTHHRCCHSGCPHSPFSHCHCQISSGNLHQDRKSTRLNSSHRL